MSKASAISALRELNTAIREGRVDALAVIENTFCVETGRAIKLEQWQVEKVLRPVLQRDADGRRSYDTYLVGLGKKNGKSTLASIVVVIALLFDDPNPEVIGVAGDRDQARIIFNYACKAFQHSPQLRPFVKIYRDAIARIDDSGVYKAISTDSETAHGTNASATVIDELWVQRNYSMIEALTHSPARKDPFIFAISYAGFSAHPGIPLYDWYLRGLRGDDPKMHMLWLDGAQANPASWITQEYLTRQRQRLPEVVYRRIHLNEWVSIDAARVFNIPADSWRGQFEEPAEGAQYVAGIDLAKYRDYTAWAILRVDIRPLRLVHFGRLPQGVDYVNQAQLLVAKLRAYHDAHALVDRGAAGPAVIELMQRELPNRVAEFTFTAKSKPDLVSNLAAAFERIDLVMPSSGNTADQAALANALRQELENYVPDVTPSGAIRYAAAPGYHDDLAMALALAHENARRVAKRSSAPWVECLRIDDGPGPGPERSWHRIN